MASFFIFYGKLEGARERLGVERPAGFRTANHMKFFPSISAEGFY